MYWLKLEQLKFYSDEIELVKKPKKDVPLIVRNLNLFLDNHGILSSRGRISKCKKLHFDACNPIILSLKSFLTEFFIWDAHESCRHLGVARVSTGFLKLNFRKFERFENENLQNGVAK